MTKPTMLVACRARGEISQDEFDAEEKKAEQQILAFGNKYVEGGTGPRFASLVSREANNALKEPPPKPQTARPSQTPPSPPAPDYETVRTRIGLELQRVAAEKQRNAQNLQDLVVYGGSGT